MDSCQLVRKETNMNVRHLNQKELASRWSISEASLERWRSEGIGPRYMKLNGRVLYRKTDIETYEESCLVTPVYDHHYRTGNQTDSCSSARPD